MHVPPVPLELPRRIRSQRSERRSYRYAGHVWPVSVLELQDGQYRLTDRSAASRAPSSRRRRCAVRSSILSDLTREELEALADEIRPPRAKGARHVDHIFWSKIKIGANTDCWPWQGFRKASGHGLTTYKSLSIHASRKAYILTHGPISSKVCVLHKCDNAACCNPAHLYPGTRADNMIDRFGNVKPEFRKATGRARVLTDKQIETLWQMRREGATLKVCAAKFNVHLATIARYITIERKRKLEKIRADRVGITQ